MKKFNFFFNYLTANRTRIQRLSKEGGWIVLGQVAVVIGSLVLVRVLTEMLSPAQYGELALALTIAMLVQQVVMGGLSGGIGRHYAIAIEEKDLGGYLKASKKLLALATLACLFFLISLEMGLGIKGYSQWQGLAAAAFVFSVLSGYNSALNNVQNAARQRAIVAVHNGLNAWLKITFAVAVMLWMGYSGTSVLLGYAIASVAVIGSQWIFLRRLITPQLSVSDKYIPWTRRIWSYSWPFSAWGIFTWLQLSSDRWALQAFATTDDVGQYAVLFQLGYTPISLVTGMAMTFLAPILYQRIGDATDQDRNKSVGILCGRITLMILFVVILSFLVANVFHVQLFRLLVADEYRSISYLFPWIVLAGGIFATGQTIALKLMAEMKSLKLAPAKIVTAILGVALNIAGASIAGINGVVFALVVFSMIYFFWMAYLGFGTNVFCSARIVQKERLP
jgi:O-antigen/teichoic acid export membrane protein